MNSRSRDNGQGGGNLAPLVDILKRFGEAVGKIVT